jgi:hypothetical protein
MKKIYFIVVFWIGYNYISCKKIDMTEQTVFENIPACVFDSTKQDPTDIRIFTSDRFDLINVEGKLYSTANYSINVRLNQSEVAKVPRDRFPVWEKRFGIIVACNMPKQLSQKDFDSVRVKLSCRLFYEPLPQQGRSIPSANGYGVELLRIELLQ